MKNDYRPNMITLFIRHCLLFRSKDKLFWFFGAFVWADIIVIIYVITRIIV